MLFCSGGRLHTICALVTGVQTCTLPIFYGVLSGQFTPFPLATAFARQLTMRTFALDAARQKLEESISTIVAGVEKGAFRPTLDRVFPIEQIVEAHRYME